MTDASLRPIVEAYYVATAARDVDGAMAFIDDRVDWLVQGPIDVFAFFGQRHGKDAVLEGYAEIARTLGVTGFEVETLLVEGDRAAAMIRYTATVLANGKTMSVRTTQFSRWRNGKIVVMRAVCDSYDMVEQALGRMIDLTAPEPELIPALN